MKGVVPANFPKALIDVAVVNGQEAAWPQEDCLKAIDWLAQNGYAVLVFELWLPEGGGIRTAISTEAGPAIYAYSCNQKKGEVWKDYVQRCALEAAGGIGAFCWPDDSLKPARRAYFNLTWASQEWFRTIQRQGGIRMLRGKVTWVGDLEKSRLGRNKDQ